MSSNSKSIDVIIPMFNERENIVSIVDHITDTIQKEFNSINFILVDDGSRDGTENEIDKIAKRQNRTLTYIRLAKNYGKDVALKCGIDRSSADVCAMIDADFQHPPEKILEAYQKMKDGYNIVHILKKEYNVGGAYRKFGSYMFRKLIYLLGGDEINLTDYKIIDKQAVSEIKNFGESFYFNCGIIDLIGLKYTSIEYEPNERRYGVSKFSFKSLIRLAINQMMAVSIKPLRISIYFGMAISSVSFLYGLYILIEKLFLGQPIPGFATLGAALFFLGGIQLLFLGIIGEYLGKAFIETKKRPQYIIHHLRQI